MRATPSLARAFPRPVSARYLVTPVRPPHRLEGPKAPNPAERALASTAKLGLLFACLLSLGAALG